MRAGDSKPLFSEHLAPLAQPLCFDQVCGALRLQKGVVMG